MDGERVKSIIEENYAIKVKDVEQVKNTYKVEAEEGIYCVKIIKYKLPHFKFILSAILHLQKQGFNTIPEIIKNKQGGYYIEFIGYYAYLTEWVTARESNFDNPIELAMVSKELASLHKCSQGFTLTKDMKPRIGWFSWIKVFDTRKNEILDFKKRISQKAYKSNFDLLYLSCLDEEVERAEKCVRLLEESNYRKLMEREMLKRGFCHHDYANHNILINNNNDIYVIDFDYCILDTHLHDLSSLLIRAMKDGRWSKEKAEIILNTYCKSIDINEEELKIMGYFMEFPQAFWQLGIQMYWEQQPWSEELFLRRLSKYIEDRECRTLFIDNFFN